MGASGSKAAQKTVRKFPARAPGVSPAATTTPRAASTPRAEAQSQPRPQASYSKDDGAIRADSTDPNSPEFISQEYADRLRQMGIVQPNPTFSPSSIANLTIDASEIQQSLSKPRFPVSSSNATLSVLEVRRQLEARAKDELENTGRSTDKGREFLDIGTVKQILVLRQRGVPASDIESRLRLRPGLVARLGAPGIVTPASP